MTPSASLSSAVLQTASVAATFPAVTTLLLWLLSRLYATPEGFDAAVQLRASHRRNHAGGCTSIATYDPVISAAYPGLQPICRAWLGVWLWRTVTSKERIGTPQLPDSIRGSAPP